MCCEVAAVDRLLSLPLLAENAKERVRRGELKMEDIPYMQRGGNWDNADLKGAKKVKWLKSNKQYADGGFKKEQVRQKNSLGLNSPRTGTLGL